MSDDPKNPTDGAKENGAGAAGVAAWTGPEAAPIAAAMQVAVSAEILSFDARAGTSAAAAGAPMIPAPAAGPPDSRTREARIVADGQKKVMEELVAEKKVFQLGNLWSFTEPEYGQLETFKSLVDGYRKLSSPPRPLCLAVFGPPGSGKSHAVREICKALDPPEGKNLPLTEVNLTLLASYAELVRVIRSVRLKTSETAIPVIFFDEFDAPLDGVALGWLTRFLAPMQDGVLFDNGDAFEFKRAVYIFAGGTAVRLTDFGARAKEHFREAKGPDFVSRLRGHIDVTGPNEPTSRTLRRAAIIRSAVEDIAKGRGTPDELLKVSSDLLHAMLHVGRYRHGARSIKAVIEMAAATAETADKLERSHLPPDHVLDVHRDLGPLDPMSTGGLIGLSAGPGGPSETDWKNVSVEIATELWKVGAVIAYGGMWNKEALTTELLGELSKQSDSLVEAASSLTNSPSPPRQVRVEVFARMKPPEPTAPRPGMVPVAVPAYWSAGNKDDSLESASAAFRMRWTMSCRCVARVLVGGKTEKFSGRMPGILEETILALALKQPLYIVGGLGGGARVVGELLGLACDWPEDGRKIGSFGASAVAGANVDRAVAATPSLFRPAGFTSLPLTFADAMAFLPGYSVGGPHWPDNGLTLEENRALFAATAEDPPDVIVKLVLRGLMRRFPG